MFGLFGEILIKKKSSFLKKYLSWLQFDDDDIFIKMYIKVNIGFAKKINWVLWSPFIAEGVKVAKNIMHTKYALHIIFKSNKKMAYFYNQQNQAFLKNA